MSESTINKPNVVRRRVLAWYRQHGRTFPWRYRDDAWQVLLGELLLQRTRADLVVPVYEDVLRRWPTAAALAKADADEVRLVLRPLGFAHRNARMQAAAVACAAGVPRSEAALLAIPGVGRYASRATLCFAFGRRLAVIDPTVLRLLDRLGFGTSGHARPRNDLRMWEAADALLPARDARSWNYAILDFGASVCRPKPRCSDCPLLDRCPAGKVLVDSAL